MGCVNATTVYSQDQQQEFCTVYASTEKTEQSTERSFHREWVLAGKLGKGSFAHVYKAAKAEDRSGPHHAVKITDLRTRKGPVVVDQRRAQQVQREVAIMKKIVGVEGCIGLIDFYVEACRSYLIMEKCDTTLLDSLHQCVELNENVLKIYITGMAEALKALHKVGVVHRDIKPSNFLISIRNGVHHVKVCDFGLAACLPASQQDQLTGICGTPPFMPPEMVLYQRYGAKADVWSLGVVLYILLTGEFPYMPADQTGKGMKAAIAAGSNLTFPATRMSTSAGLLMTGMLSREPQHRATAESVLGSTWLQKPTPGAKCLKAALQQAQWLGAFEEHKVQDQSPASTSMESHLLTMQRKYHCAGTPTSKNGSGQLKGKDQVSLQLSDASTATPPGDTKVDFGFNDSA